MESYKVEIVKGLCFDVVLNRLEKWKYGVNGIFEVFLGVDCVGVIKLPYEDRFKPFIVDMIKRHILEDRTLKGVITRNLNKMRLKNG